MARRVRELDKQGYTQTAIAKRLNISQSQVSRILNGNPELDNLDEDAAEGAKLVRPLLLGAWFKSHPGEGVTVKQAIQIWNEVGSIKEARVRALLNEMVARGDLCEGGRQGRGGEKVYMPACPHWTATGNEVEHA